VVGAVAADTLDRDVCHRYESPATEGSSAHP